MSEDVPATGPTPRVSVVIPTYNRAARVMEAIGSIRAQSLEDFEIVVVDDGSTDDTAARLAALGAEEPRLRFVSQPNGGVGAARTRGLALARAPWTAFLDSDDLWLPGFLEAQLAFLEAHPDTDLVLCDAQLEGDWGLDADTLFGLRSWKAPVTLDAMLDFAWGLPSAMVLSTEVGRRLGFSDDRLGEDTDFLFRFHVARHVLRTNPRVLTRYRCHAGDDGAPQLVSDRQAVQRGSAQVVQRYVGHAADPAQAYARIARLLALDHCRQGQWAEARPHLWAWWRYKPDSTRALRYLLRSLVARPGRRGHPARPSRRPNER